MPRLRMVISNYEKLCAYCAGFWERIRNKYPTGLKCSPGCSACCELQSVNFLEAYVIALCRDRAPFPFQSSQNSGNGCCFLADGRCGIYPARPVICRTHGLLLKSSSFRGRIVPSCPENFTGVEFAAFSDADAFDIDRITINLARLNAAFCILCGAMEKNKERVALVDIASGKITRPWFGV